jgi:hypothetical protein
MERCSMAGDLVTLVLDVHGLDQSFTLLGLSTVVHSIKSKAVPSNLGE